MVEWKISNHVRICQNIIIRVFFITYIWVSKAVSNKQERITTPEVKKQIENLKRQMNRANERRYFSGENYSRNHKGNR